MTHTNSNALLIVIVICGLMLFCTQTIVLAQQSLYGRHISGFEEVHWTDVLLDGPSLLRCGTVDAGVALPSETAHNDLSGNGLDVVVIRTNWSGDSVLSWIRFGGGLDDLAVRLRKLGDGSVVVAGTTSSVNFPSGQLNSVTTSSGGSDIFVAVLESSLTAIQRTRLVGGLGNEECADLELIDDSRILLCGSTTSPNLPTTLPPLARIDAGTPQERTYAGGGAPLGGTDGLLAVVSTTGTLLHCRYMGSSGNDAINGVCVLSDGTLAVTGTVGSSDFQTLPLPPPDNINVPQVPFQVNSRGGGSDAMVARINADLSAANANPFLEVVNFTAYLGGTGMDIGVDVTQASNGDILVAGTTTSMDVGRSEVTQGSPAGGRDVFVARVSRDGQRLTRITYIGGRSDDVLSGISTHVSVRGLILHGTTSSTDFPCLAMATPCPAGGSDDGFLAVYNESQLSIATTIGGNKQDTILGATYGPTGDIYATLVSSEKNLLFDAVDGLPSLSHVSIVAQGQLSSIMAATSNNVCPDGIIAVPFTASNMRSSDRYAIRVRGSDKIWRTVASNLSAQTAQISAGQLSLGTYDVRILTDRGPYVDISNGFSILPERRIDVVTNEGVICLGDYIFYDVLDNMMFGDPISILINDSIRTDLPSLTGLLQSLKAGVYVIRASTSRGCDGSVISVLDTIALVEQPTIVTDPESFTIAPNAFLELSVVAIGDDLIFQWQRNGLEIPGETTSRFVRANASSEDEGIYTCIVTNSCGAVVSSPAVVRLGTVSVESSTTEASIGVRGDYLVSNGGGMIPYDIHVYDSMGRLLTSKKDALLPFFLPAISSGWHVARLRSGDTTIHIPFLR